jgi:hypothetical protein
LILNSRRFILPQDHDKNRPTPAPRERRRILPAESAEPTGETLTIRLPRIDWIGRCIRTIRELLGHKDIGAAMMDTHVGNKGGHGVRGPMDGQWSG